MSQLKQPRRRLLHRRTRDVHVEDEDPTWYAEQAAILQAELDKRESALREAETNSHKLRRNNATGIANDKKNAGITPEQASPCCKRRSSKSKPAR